MDEAKAMRHRVPLRNKEWGWVPRASRAALPEVAKQNGYDIPKSLFVNEARGEVPSTAIRDLTLLALEIVPIHDQAEAMYRWFGTLTQLEAEDNLKRAALPERVQKTLRGVPWAHKAIQKELEEHEGAYFDRHGDHGGWTQLKMIIEWTFFLHMWQVLEQEAASPRDVVRALSALAPARTLSTLSEIRALAGTD
jgi:hypothetical protein